MNQKTDPLHSINITKRPTRTQMFEFENLLHAEDFEGIRLWHKVYTPWCSDDTVDRYICDYKAALIPNDNE